MRSVVNCPLPVEPNPPLPRACCIERIRVPQAAHCDTGAMTICAMRIAATDHKWFAAQIHQNDLYFAAVVGVDRAGRVEHGDAVPRRKSGARPHLALGSRAAARSRCRSGSSARAPGAIVDRRVGRHRGDQIEAGGVRALIGRQRQIGAVRQAHDAHFDASSCDLASVQASRRCARPAPRATSSLDCGGQVFDAVGGDQMNGVAVAAHDAGLAATRRWRRSSRSPCGRAWPWRWSMTFSVSAAKPIDQLRPAGSCDARWWTRMSGFSTSASSGVPLPCLLDLLRARLARRASRRPRRRTPRRRPATPARPPPASRARFRPGRPSRRADRAHSPGRNQRHLGAGGAPPPPRWRGPACPTSGWRCSAPDRSARASAPT